MALRIAPPGGLVRPAAEGTRFPKSTLPLSKLPLGSEAKFPSRITNVQVVDFDRDGISDVLVCDALRNALLWHRQSPIGTWEERVLGEDLVAPAHATVIDLDRDGDRDVIVSVLGNIHPDDTHVGRVVWLEQTPTGFAPHVLLDDVRRVADVQAGDLDGDGDLDLAVAVFGYARGEILWLENHGGGNFEEHAIHSGPGPIHVPIADFDGDGDLDLCTVYSQNEEEVWGFENLGAGKFQPRRLDFTFNFDIGSAGLVAADLDRDGDTDLLWPLGDNLEYEYTYPQSYHGCFWLENQGDWKFTRRRIASFGGCYAAAVADLDADQDNDVVLVSLFNDWHVPGHASIVWLENDGDQNFTTRQIDDTPTHLVTVACGDLDGDGRDDIVAGGLHVTRSDRNLGGVVTWISGRGARR
jgi:FG-GAP-like repeat